MSRPKLRYYRGASDHRIHQPAPDYNHRQGYYGSHHYPLRQRGYFRYLLYIRRPVGYPALFLAAYACMMHSRSRTA